MTQGDDSGRATSVHERATVSEARFLAVQRALADVQCHSASARSVSYGQHSSGGLVEVTADERAIDAGAVGRGRDGWARITATSGEGRRALVWLVDYAWVGDLGSLAALYAANAAPVDLLARRDLAALSLEAATTGHAAAKQALANARRVLSAARTPETTTAHLRAKAAADVAAVRLATAEGEVARVDRALLAWGLAAMGAAVEAWEDAGREERAA